MKKAFARTTKSLSESGIDTIASGSTCCLAYISNTDIYCVNLGDSRAVLYSKDQDYWSCKPLSFDHKSEEKREAQRIIANGGRVFPYYDENGEQMGPFRVWLKEKNIPGLAMTRSFGDLLATTIGVISEPEVVHSKISKSSNYTP